MIAVTSHGIRTEIKYDELGMPCLDPVEYKFPDSLPKGLNLWVFVRIINKIISIVKNSWYEIDNFETKGDKLQVDYKWLRHLSWLADINLLENVPETLWISAESLASYLNARFDIKEQ